MTLADDEVERVLAAAETIAESLGILTEYQSMSREAYRGDREARDVVERRFVKATEAALDVASTLVGHERRERAGQQPGHDAGARRRGGRGRRDSRVDGTGRPLQ